MVTPLFNGQPGFPMPGAMPANRFAGIQPLSRPPVRPRFGDDSTGKGDGKGGDGQDKVDTSATRPGGDVKPTDGVKTDGADTQHQTPPESTPPAAGKGQNGRILLGLFFKKVVPLLLSLAWFAPPWGLIIGLAGIPLSFISGRIGNHIMKGVDEDKASGAAANFKKLDDLLSNPTGAKDGEVVDHLNRTLEDLLNVKRFPFLTDFLTKYAKLSKDKGIGKVLNRYTMLKANVYTEVADSDSIGGAAAATIRGGWQYFVYFKLLPGIGEWLEKMSTAAPGPFKYVFKGLGLLLHYFGFLKLAKDMATPEGNPPPKQ